MDSGLTASDIALLDGNNGMGGGNAFLWIFALLILAGGGFGGFGLNRQGELGQYATAASQQEILFGQRFDAIGQKINQIGDGICSSTYALNNAIVNEGRTLGAAVNAGFSNLQNCCCETQRAIDGVNYNTTVQVQKVLDALAQNKIDSLQAEVNSLKTQNMFCGVPKINPYGYGVYPYNNGCGCGNI